MRSRWRSKDSGPNSFVDGEVEPSVVLEPAMSVGQSFSATTVAGEWFNAQSQVGDGTTFCSAGSKMGRSGVGGGGWWHRHPVLFQRSIYIEIAVVAVPNASRVFGNATGPPPPLPSSHRPDACKPRRSCEATSAARPLRLHQVWCFPSTPG